MKPTNISLTVYVRNLNTIDETKFVRSIICQIFLKFITQIPNQRGRVISWAGQLDSFGKTYIHWAWRVQITFGVSKYAQKLINYLIDGVGVVSPKINFDDSFFQKKLEEME